MEPINFVSPNIGINNIDKQLIEDGVCNSNQRENSSLYSFPGILHFLQAEWNKMESERAHWEIEKAELLAKIAFLQGEKKGQDCLKEDLIRRIKMLEFALKQKNQIIMELKYGVSTSNSVATVDSSKNNVDESTKMKEPNTKLNNDLEKAKAASSEWRESRQRLRRFLQEVGHVDAILDARQFRLRSLLSEGLYSKLVEEQMPVKGNDESLIDAENSVLKSFDFLSQEKDSNKGDEFSNETNHYDNKGSEEDNLWTTQFSNKFNIKNTENDENQLSGKVKVKGMSKFGRFSKKDSEFMDFLAQLNDENIGSDESIEDKEKKDKKQLNTLQTDYYFTPKCGLGDLASITVANETDGENEVSKPFGSSGVAGSASINGQQNDVGNDQVDSTASKNLESSATTFWNVKYTLRGHFDSVRCLSFYNSETAILSGSDDGTIKVWNFGKSEDSKKGLNQEIEAVQTLRGHDGSVLSVQFIGNQFKSSNTDKLLAVSGGIDGSLRFWNLPNLEIDPYEVYDPSQNALVVPDAHLDPIWKVGYILKESVIFSVSPYKIKLWSLMNSEKMSSLKEENSIFYASDFGCSLLKEYELSDLVNCKKDSRITSATLLKYDNSQLAIGTSTGQFYAIDLKADKVEFSLDIGTSNEKVINDGKLWTNEGITCMTSHPTLPMVYCGHQDNHLRIIDLRQNCVTYSMVVHQDAVSAIDNEEYGIYFMTGSHDGSMRLWDLEKRSCVQEMSSHRMKDNESVHSVIFHPSLPYVGSSGADGVVKIYS